MVRSPEEIQQKILRFQAVCGVEPAGAIAQAFLSTLVFAAKTNQQVLRRKLVDLSKEAKELSAITIDEYWNCSVTERRRRLEIVGEGKALLWVLEKIPEINEWEFVPLAC